MDIDQAFQNLVDKVVSWVEGFIIALPNIVAALLIVIGFLLLARLAQRFVGQAADRVSSYKQVNRLLATLSYVAVLAVGVFIALGVLELTGMVAALLGGVGIIGLAVGFAFQDITTNFISGVLLSIRRPFREGDVIETNDFFGVVREVNLRSTLVRTFQGELVSIPNKEVYQNPMVNYSYLGKRRVDLSCGVAYGDDLEKARRVAIEAIEAIDERDKSQDVELFYNAFGGSSVDFTLRFWIDFEKQTDFLKAQSEAIMRLKRAFDEQGITIPFPIRTLDFGVVGGEKLSDVLPPSLYEQNGENRSRDLRSASEPGSAGAA